MFKFNQCNQMVLGIYIAAGKYLFISSFKQMNYHA
jgi:hypothetical protein